MAGILQTSTLGITPAWSVCPIERNETSTITVHRRDRGREVSPMVRAKQMVRYRWDNKWYYGRQIAANRSRKVLAYGIQRSGRESGSFRIMDLVTNNRTLIDDLRGPITDLAFCPKAPLLAVVDNFGQLYIYEYICTPASIEGKLKLQTVQGEAAASSDLHLLNWCPWIDEGADEDDEEDDSISKRSVFWLSLGFWSEGTASVRWFIPPSSSLGLRRLIVSVLSFQNPI